MGTNLFVEGQPSPVVLSITVPREARAFRDIGEISSALAEVDTMLRRDCTRRGQVTVIAEHGKSGYFDFVSTHPPSLRF